MGVFVVVCAVSGAIAAVAAVGFIGYVIYKTRTKVKEGKYRCKECKPPFNLSKEHVKEFITIEDAKLMTGTDTGLRQRNVKINTFLETEENVKAAPVINVRSKTSEEIQPANFTSNLNGNNNFSNQKSHQETQTTELIENHTGNNLLNMACHQETQTSEGLNELDHLLLGGQDTQATDSLPGVDFFPGNFSNNINSLSRGNFCGENSVIHSGTASVLSTDSNETVSSNASSRCNIPTWHEMSDAEKGACICEPCGRVVTTITYPCKHPYFCSSCAPTMFKFYHRCCSCKHRIKSYDNIF